MPERSHMKNTTKLPIILFVPVNAPRYTQEMDLAEIPEDLAFLSQETEEIQKADLVKETPLEEEDDCTIIISEEKPDASDLDFSIDWENKFESYSDENVCVILLKTKDIFDFVNTNSHQ